jgi:asparagine synthase (glutamine-hydrolysing)
VALYYVSGLARNHVKVLLSGEGGDEAFAGYPNYPNRLKLQRLQNALGPLARPVGAIAELMGRVSGEGRVQRYGAALGRPLAQTYFSRTTGPTSFFHGRGVELFTPDFLAATSSVSAAALMEKLLAPMTGRPLLDQMLYADTKTWLPDDLLVKADKITMANSLELRVPLLDHEVLEFAASLPARYKVQGRETKRALKAAFARVLPQEILTRKKAGFPVPYNGWLRGELAEGVRDLLLSAQARTRDWFRRDQVEQLLAANQRHGGSPKEVFCLLTLELWFRRFLA